MNTQIIWINGELVKSSMPSLSANDHGFLLGDGIFETLIEHVILGNSVIPAMTTGGSHRAPVILNDAAIHVQLA